MHTQQKDKFSKNGDKILRAYKIYRYTSIHSFPFPKHTVNDSWPTPDILHWKKIGFNLATESDVRNYKLCNPSCIWKLSKMIPNNEGKKKREIKENSPKNNTNTPNNDDRSDEYTNFTQEEERKFKDRTVSAPLAIFTPFIHVKRQTIQVDKLPQQTNIFQLSIKQCKTMGRHPNNTKTFIANQVSTFSDKSMGKICEWVQIAHQERNEKLNPTGDLKNYNSMSSHTCRLCYSKEIYDSYQGRRRHIIKQCNKTLQLRVHTWHTELGTKLHHTYKIPYMRPWGLLISSIEEYMEQCIIIGLWYPIVN